MAAEDPSPSTDAINLVGVAESTLRSLNKWSWIDSNLHSWFVSLALAGSIVVPFGLTALLFVEEKDAKRLLNIALITISAISLILQLLDIQLHLGERAKHNRQKLDKLKLAIADFKDGVTSRTTLKNTLIETMGGSLENEE